MIFWCIIISYFTVAIFLYLIAIFTAHKISDGDITEALRYLGGEDTINDVEIIYKEYTSSVENFLWLMALIGCLLWPWVYVYEPIKRHFTK